MINISDTKELQILMHEEDSEKEQARNHGQTKEDLLR